MEVEKKEAFGESQEQSKESRSTFWKRVLSSFWLFGAIFSLGFLQGERGPSLLDLQLLTDTDTDVASTFFTCGAWGYLLGALCAGFLFDRFNRGQLQLAVALLIMAVSNGVTPLCPNYSSMMAIFFVGGVSSGVVDASANAELMRLWRLRAGPYMQALHFSFALGSLISPLIVAPFLVPEPDEENATLTTASPAFDPSPAAVSNVTANPLNSTSSHAQAKEETHILVAFLIGTGVTLLLTIPFLPCFPKAQPVDAATSESTPEPPEPSKDEKSKEKKIPMLYYVVVIVLLALFYFIYVSLENCFSTFLLTFMVKDQKWRKTISAVLTSVFWASFSAMRFGGIFFITRFSPVKMMLFSCSTLALSFYGFTLSTNFHFPEGIWICTVTTGLSMSILFPTGLLFAEDSFFRVTGKTMSLLLLSASAGGMIMSPVFGNVMTNVDNRWFCYLFDIMVTFLISVLVSMVVLSKTLFAKHDKHPSTSAP